MPDIKTGYTGSGSTQDSMHLPSITKVRLNCLAHQVAMPLPRKPLPCKPLLVCLASHHSTGDDTWSAIYSQIRINVRPLLILSCCFSKRPTARLATAMAAPRVSCWALSSASVPSLLTRRGNPAMIPEGLSPSPHGLTRGPSAGGQLFPRMRLPQSMDRRSPIGLVVGLPATAQERPH